jgi:hypothetical protein
LSQETYRVQLFAEGVRVTFFSAPIASIVKSAPPQDLHATVTIGEVSGGPLDSQLPAGIGFWLTLSAPLPVDSSTAALLLAMLQEAEPPAPFRQEDSGASLADLVLGSSVASGPQAAQVLDQVHVYEVARSGRRGLLLQRLPVFRASQLPGLFGILRQIAVCNYLLAQCFPETSNSVLPGPVASAPSLAVEVHLVAPNRLKLLTLAPAREPLSLVCMEVQVSPTGSLLLTTDAGCDPQRLQALQLALNATLSPPLLLRALLTTSRPAKAQAGPS